MNGYSQAVQNLAYAVDSLSANSMDDAIMQGIVDLDVINTMMTPEQQREWHKIEEVSQVICKTYNVKYEQLMEDVWKTLLNDIEAMFDGDEPKHLH